MTQTVTKKVALRCSSNNENYNADFDYAVVEVTAALAKSIEARRALFTTAKAQDKQLSMMTFHDYSPRYFKATDVLTNPHDDGTELDYFMDGSDIEVIPAEFNTELHDDDRDFYTEGDRMEITESGVRWTCIPKHSGITIETAELSYKDIAEFAA